MLISELDPDHLSMHQIAKLLFDFSDDGKAGDCIFVPGSSKCVEYRVPVAVELFKVERARKILFSGGRTWTGSGSGKPEAILMRDKAVALGVPVDAILTEARSLNTRANVLESSLLLNEAVGLPNITQVILVTTAYHMRRLYLTMRTHLPGSIGYSCCPAQDNSTRKDNWWLNQNGKARVTEEARKLINYVRQGVLIDSSF